MKYNITACPNCDLTYCCTASCTVSCTAVWRWSCLPGTQPGPPLATACQTNLWWHHRHSSKLSQSCRFQTLSVRGGGGTMYLPLTKILPHSVTRRLFLHIICFWSAITQEFLVVVCEVFFLSIDFSVYWWSGDMSNMTGDAQQVTHDSWHLTGDRRLMTWDRFILWRFSSLVTLQCLSTVKATCDMRQVTHDTWQVTWDILYVTRDRFL